MELPNGFRLTRATDMATFIVKNKDDLANALRELADSYADEHGTRGAYERVADMCQPAIRTGANPPNPAAFRRYWINPDLARRVTELAEELRANAPTG